MKGLAELALSFIDLLEAEGRSLKRNLGRTGLGCGLGAIGVIFLGGAFSFLILAAYEALADIVPRSAAWLILAGCCLLVTLTLLWSARLCLGKRQKKSKRKK